MSAIEFVRINEYVVVNTAHIVAMDYWPPEDSHIDDDGEKTPARAAKMLVYTDITEAADGENHHPGPIIYTARGEYCDFLLKWRDVRAAPRAL